MLALVVTKKRLTLRNENIWHSTATHYAAGILVRPHTLTRGAV